MIFTGVPDDLGCQDGGVTAGAAQEVVVDPHPGVLVDPPRLTRGFRIQAQDLRDVGYPQHCPKCNAMCAGRKRRNESW